MEGCLQILTQQIDLWEKYIESITEREGMEVLDYAQDLARRNIIEGKADFTLQIINLSKAANLISIGE